MKFGHDNLSNRQKWVEKTLKNLPENLSLIDVGAGECQYKIFCDHLIYTSQDFNQYSGIGNNIGFQTGQWDVSQIDIVSDITKIPVNNCQFDVVLCTEVLEHVPDPVASIEEMNRILKPNGLLIITAPFCSLTHFAPFHYCDGFNQYFYEYHLGRLGYEIVELTPNGNYFSYLSQELIRLPKVIEDYCGEKSFFVLFISKILNFLLRFYDKDNKSSSILCYGYHVVAKKK
jgi:ubiquinone/menaquinone biosynthesis C-methylase UbiE